VCAASHRGGAQAQTVGGRDRSGPAARRDRARVSELAPRGAEHHLILDSFKGVKGSESTSATQLGAIAGQVAASKDEAGFAATAARLRVAAAVFGG
jgi:hypothetical protein